MLLAGKGFQKDGGTRTGMRKGDVATNLDQGGEGSSRKRGGMSRRVPHKSVTHRSSVGTFVSWSNDRSDLKGFPFTIKERGGPNRGWKG